MMKPDSGNECFRRHAWWFFLVLGISLALAGWLRGEYGGVDDRLRMVEQAQATTEARWVSVQESLKRIERGLTMHIEKEKP